MMRVGLYKQVEFASDISNFMRFAHSRKGVQDVESEDNGFLQNFFKKISFPRSRRASKTDSNS